MTISLVLEVFAHEQSSGKGDDDDNDDYTTKTLHKLQFILWGIWRFEDHFMVIKLCHLQINPYPRIVSLVNSLYSCKWLMIMNIYVDWFTSILCIKKATLAYICQMLHNNVKQLNVNNEYRWNITKKFSVNSIRRNNLKEITIYTLNIGYFDVGCACLQRQGEATQ